MSPHPEERERPLSPHLQIYKPQITSVLSILHRMTGVFLYFGTFLLILWLTCLSLGQEHYATLQGWIKSPLGYLILMGWSFSLFYHLCNGVRHLLWDLGYGYNLDTVTKSGWLVVGCAFVFSLFSWVLACVWGIIWS